MENINWTLYAVIIVIGICMVNGLRRGLIKTAFSMFSLVFIMAVVYFLNPYVGNFFMEHTPLPQKIEYSITKVIQDKIEEPDKELGIHDQINLIENLPLPESLKNSLIENNNEEIYKVFSTDTFLGYITEYITSSIINGLSYLLSFFIAALLIGFLVHVLDIVARLPVIKTCNNLGGGVLGLVQGILLIWIVFLGITIFSSTSIGNQIIVQINQNTFLTYLYKYNYLLNIITNVF